MAPKILLFLIISLSRPAFAQDISYGAIIKRALQAKRLDIALSIVESKISSTDVEKNQDNFANICQFLLAEYTRDPSTIIFYKDVDGYLFQFLQKTPEKCSPNCIESLLNVHSFYSSPTLIFYKWQTLAKDSILSSRITLGGTFSLNTALSKIENSCQSIVNSPINTKPQPFEEIINYICHKLLKKEIAQKLEKISPESIAYINLVATPHATASLPNPKFFIDHMILAILSYKDKKVKTAENHFINAFKVANTLSQKAFSTHALYIVTKNKKYEVQLRDYLKHMQFNESNDGLKHIIDQAQKDTLVKPEPNMYLPYSLLKAYMSIMLN